MEEYNLFWTSCAVHYIDIMLKNMGKIVATSFWQVLSWFIRNRRETRVFILVGRLSTIHLWL